MARSANDDETAITRSSSRGQDATPQHGRWVVVVVYVIAALALALAIIERVVD